MDNKQLTQTEIKKIADELSIMEVQLQSTMERIRTLRKIIVPDENGKPRKKTKREERKEIVALAVQRQMAKLLKNSKNG